MQSADYWIGKLQLVPLPEEGGMYRELYRAEERIPADALPPRFVGDRCFSTSIYYLLRHPELSALHRLHQDEIWHFYEGDPLSVCILGPEGACRVEHMGRDAERGEVLQLVLRTGEIFGASVARPGGYALTGCSVAPGFEFQDFELVDRETLLAAYPAYRGLILQYTRERFIH
jgi:predicted cupin superfamily sugar epimerase